MVLPDLTGLGCLLAHRRVQDRGSCRGLAYSAEPARSDPLS